MKHHVRHWLRRHGLGRLLCTRGWHYFEAVMTEQGFKGMACVFCEKHRWEVWGENIAKTWVRR